MIEICLDHNQMSYICSYRIKGEYADISFSNPIMRHDLEDFLRGIVGYVEIPDFPEKATVSADLFTVFDPLLDDILRDYPLRFARDADAILFKMVCEA